MILFILFVKPTRFWALGSEGVENGTEKKSEIFLSFLPSAEHK